MSSADTWNVTLRYLEDGFFVDDAGPSSQRAAQFTWRPVAGLEAPVQFFRIRVDADDFAELGGEVWLVSADGIAQDEAALDRLRTRLDEALPHVDFCFMVEQRVGFARVLGTARRAIVVAAATAVVKHKAAWDESPSITIAIGEQSFAVSVGFEGKNYRVVVRRG